MRCETLKSVVTDLVASRHPQAKVPDAVIALKLHTRHTCLQMAEVSTRNLFGGHPETDSTIDSAGADVTKL